LEVRRLQRLVPIFEEGEKRKSTNNCNTIDDNYKFWRERQWDIF
jgi:hypothetical protein